MLPTLMTTPFAAIIERPIPPVAGIDLEQALNYVDSRGLPLEWFYTSFTCPRTFYRPGSRPQLAEFIQRQNLDHGRNVATVRAVLQAVNQGVRHACFLNRPVPADRGLTEEGLLESSCGWCNEQARVAVALSQVVGIPSRLVFASMKTGRGHVMSEFYMDERWALADQTIGFLFQTPAGETANVLTIRTAPALADEINAFYREALLATRPLAPNPAQWDESFTYIHKPLELFHHVGYCNYFVH
ncbi:MAG: transglutaminase domain-containing protein [Verrucomicrobia bacterium]|nr:transglutaminase domain-containing protein [Verrucomicrobiota bacterium]